MEFDGARGAEFKLTVLELQLVLFVESFLMNWN